MTKPKYTTKEWIEETIKRFGKYVFEESWICLFLTKNYLDNKPKKK